MNMRNVRRRMPFGVACFLALLAIARAEVPPGPPSPSEWPAVTDSAKQGSKHFEAIHVGTFGGRKLRYKSSVDETILVGPDGARAASAITITYTAGMGSSVASRPVVFVYNGGPGCASSFLQFGALGPRRMASFSDQAMRDASTPLVDNPQTILDVADLVFIDPPDTGYSRLLEGTPPRLFMSIDGDSFAVGQLILNWLSTNHRLNSPVYLVGESYGTKRTVALARDLSKGVPRARLRGLTLISQSITSNGPADRAAQQNDPMRAITRLPDMAALAWYYGKIENKKQNLEEAVRKAIVFARTEYASALLQGNTLPSEDKAKVAARLAELTGVSAQYYLAHNLRVTDFRRELLREQGLALTQFDGRVTEPLQGVVEDRDRDWGAKFRGINAIMDAYVSGDLKAAGLRDYRSCVNDPYGYEEGWTYVIPPKPTLDVVLSETMKAHDDLRLLVPVGLFDTSSSMGRTISMFQQLDISKQRVALTFYAGGHMMYADEKSLTKLLNELRVFVSGQTPSESFPEVKAPR